MEPLHLALAALEEGKEREALAWLERASPASRAEAAEALALRGFLLARRGDLKAYRALAQEACRLAPTPLTLYHLGLALPPKDGVVTLEEALHRFRWNPRAEARLHLALAIALERLGRPEALAHAALARLKDPSPWTRLHHLRLELFFGSLPLPEILEEAEGFLPHEFPGVRLLAGHTLALAHLLRGNPQRARTLLQGLLPLLGPGSLASFLVLGALALKPLEARLLLEAAQAHPQEGWPQGFTLLARGLLERGEAAKDLLLSAHSLLRKDGALYALLAEARLQALGVGVEAPLAPHLGPALRPEARAFLLGQREEPILRLLGAAPTHPLSSKALEALALLLAYPEGQKGEALAEALYGEPNLGALKVLLHRLRQRGFRISCAPYRLENPPPSDLAAFRQALFQGDLRGALALYQGPLLPWSEAPGVEALREELEETLRQAVLARGTLEDLYTLAQRLGEDLELWEALLERLPPEDPRRPIAQARVERLRREYGV
ncbi:hypothetical protein GCM10007092_16140 [Thermus composti]|uniref:Tetratricopeptide repeat protein n=1 Tax=Thermus composti TaxID=532059 RepID=A0ABV6Q4W3_9DEIN|nr:hypothetical protein [Thermus composti]GGN02609.1 hypothetical protein GCM10007092_16140 [Thermus composti]